MKHIYTVYNVYKVLNNSFYTRGNRTMSHIFMNVNNEYRKSIKQR